METKEKFTSETLESNAALISAAPDLLKACKDALKVMRGEVEKVLDALREEGYPDDCGIEETWEDIISNPLTVQYGLAKAIAKAEGGDHERN